MSNNEAVAFLLTMRSAPTQGSKAIEKVFDFTTKTIETGDLFLEQESGVMDFVQSIKIDNSKNAQQFEIVFKGVGVMGDRIVAAPYTINYFPVMTPAQSKVEFVAQSLGAVAVQVMFFNIELPYITYEVQQPQTGVQSGSWLDHSSVTVAATSKIAVPANANRVRVYIQNPSTNANSFFVNYTVPATMDYISEEIQPGGSFDTTNGPLSLDDITIISLTAQNYTAKQLVSV